MCIFSIIYSVIYSFMITCATSTLGMLNKCLTYCDIDIYNHLFSNSFDSLIILLHIVDITVLI